MSVEVSERAVQEAKRVLDEQGMDSSIHALRIGVSSGGCSGFNYKLGFDKLDEIDSENDMRSEQHGLLVVVDKRVEQLVNGTTVDFHEGLQQRGFVFNNPNAQSCCGCGNSFSCSR